MTINQVESFDGVKITTINIGRMSRHEGLNLAQKLNGLTYMNFEILVCPAGGECAISAQSVYDGSEEEIMGMFVFLMASELAR